MGLRNFALYHRVFAHEASPGGSGGKIVPMGELDAKAIVPEAALHTLDQLLESIAPEGETSAYAVQRSLIPEAIGSFACLIVCHPSHRDGIERPASVTHARVVRIDSAEAWLDIDALIRLADGFPADVLQGPLDGDFAHFLGANEPAVTIAGWNAARFEDVSRPFARYVAGACLSRWSRNEAVFHVEPRDSIALLSDIAAAWSILPLYAQLACPFSLHAQRGARVNALFSTVAPGNDGDVPDNLKRWVTEYVDWVHDRPDDVRLLTEGREIRDLKTLESQFRALTTEARGVEGVPKTAGEGAMSKQRRPAALERNIRRGGLDQELVAAINKQVRSAEESLRDYVDKRVGAAGAVNRGGRSGGGDAASGHSLRGRMRHLAPWVQPIVVTVVALGLIAAFIYFVAQGRARDARLAALANRIATLEERHVATSSHGQPATAPAQQAEPQHHQLTPATELPGDGWAVRFQGLNERDPKRLATITNAVVTGNEETAMPANIGAQFAKMREQLSAGTKLGKTDRALLRTLLMQCIADQAAENGDPAMNIDGKFAGTPKVLLKRVKARFNVVSKPGNEEQTADFEAEAILRWAKEKGL